MMTKASTVVTRPSTKLLSSDAEAALLAAPSKKNLIQWPTEQEIQGVSEELARIKETGIRSEAGGDYFRSGDLAYQIQEIIRATADLSKKSQRRKE